MFAQPLDVFHQLKIAASFVDLFDRVGSSDFIDQVAQNHAIFQYVLKPGKIRDNLALSNEFPSYDLITVDRWVALSPERLESNPRPLTPVGGYDFQPRSIKYQGERGNVVLTKKV